MYDSKVEIEWYASEIEQNMLAETMLALKRTGLSLKGESSPTAPIESGDLRGNCSVAFDREVISPPEPATDEPLALIPVEIPEERLVARVGYTLPYALIQHESMEFIHPMGGKAKYLEDPFNRKKKLYFNAIAKAAGKGVHR